MDDHGRMLPSLFFKRGKQIEYLRRGCSFRRSRRSGEVETALVSSLYTDGHDIPHIRFHLVFEKPFRAPVKDGPRVLSVKEFFKQYPDRVDTRQPRPEAPREAETIEPVKLVPQAAIPPRAASL